MAYFGRHPKDSEHRLEKRISHGGEIHSFLNGGGVPYMAVYTSEGEEDMSTACDGRTNMEVISYLENIWEQGRRWEPVSV